MTGYKDENRPAFRRASEVLRGLGMNVISPDELDQLDPVTAPKPGWSDYLRRDIGHVRHATSCVLLPGWRASRGARLEVAILNTLGCPIFELLGLDGPENCERLERIENDLPTVTT